MNWQTCGYAVSACFKFPLICAKKNPKLDHIDYKRLQTYTNQDKDSIHGFEFLTPC